MKILSFFSFAALALLLVTGCNKTSDVDKAAQKLCDCATPMVALQKEIQEAGSDAEKMTDLMSRAQTVSSEMETCMTAIDNEYKDKQEDEEFQTKIMEALKTKCPDVHTAMSAF